MQILGRKSVTRQERHAKAQHLGAAINYICNRAEEQAVGLSGGEVDTSCDAHDRAERRRTSGSMAHSSDSSMFDHLRNFPRAQISPNPIKDEYDLAFPAIAASLCVCVPMRNLCHIAEASLSSQKISKATGKHGHLCGLGFWLKLCASRLCSIPVKVPSNVSACRSQWLPKCKMLLASTFDAHLRPFPPCIQLTQMPLLHQA